MDRNKMKFKFKIQQYQTDAVNAIAEKYPGAFQHQRVANAFTQVRRGRSGRGNGDGHGQDLRLYQIHV